MKPLSKVEIENLMAYPSTENIMKNAERLIHTALLAHQTKEALEGIAADPNVKTIQPSVYLFREHAREALALWVTND